MFKLIFQKSKVPSGGFESIVVIIEFSPIFRARLYASVTPDHSKNIKDYQLNTLKVLFCNKISKHLSKKCQIYEKLGILGGFRQN